MTADYHNKKGYHVCYCDACQEAKCRALTAYFRIGCMPLTAGEFRSLFGVMNQETIRHADKVCVLCKDFLIRVR